MSTPSPRRLRRWVSGCALLLLALITLGTAVGLVALRVRQSRAAQQIIRDGGASHLNPAERVYLQGYLVANVETLHEPAGSQTAVTPFTVSPGDGAGQVADNLIQAGLLDNRELFVNYVRYYGYDAQLEAGNFQVEPGLSTAELAQLLLDAYADEVTVTFIEGWRLEEMARSLAITRPAAIDPDEFLAIVRRERPFDLSPYDFLASLPAEATLEGYLFPDTYRVPIEADAEYLVTAMLENFGRRITPALRQAYGTQGLSLREAVTLASIVQREAVLADERPLIAGVFLNRLAVGMMLQADPTVQYAVGYWAEGDSWWKNPLWVDDLRFDSPYNSYVYTGLPPGPIANPGLGALEAVAFPTPSDYIFFVANCGAQKDGSHQFSVTYEEHLAKVESCR